MTPELRPEYSKLGKTQQIPLKGLLSHLDKLRTLYLSQAKGEDLSMMVTEFGINRSVEDLQEKMRQMTQFGRGLDVNLKTDPQFLADAIVLTLLYKINVPSAREREKDNESMEFMTAVDNLFRLDSEGHEQNEDVLKIREEAVNTLIQNYEWSKKQIKLKSIHKGKLDPEERKRLNNGDREKIVQTVKYTKPKSLESAFEDEIEPLSSENQDKQAYNHKKPIMIGVLGVAGLVTCGAISWMVNKSGMLSTDEKFPILGGIGILALSILAAGLIFGRIEKSKQPFAYKRNDRETSVDLMGIQNRLRYISSQNVELTHFVSSTDGSDETRVIDDILNATESKAFATGITRNLLSLDITRVTIIYDQYHKEQELIGYIIDRPVGKKREKAIMFVKKMAGFDRLAAQNALNMHKDDFNDLADSIFGPESRSRFVLPFNAPIETTNAGGILNAHGHKVKHED